MAHPAKARKLAEESLAFHSRKVGNRDEEFETRLSDLLADLMHLANAKGVEFDEVVAHALRNFQGERLEYGRDA
jgi:phosphoribosyl-ATP pyrophosphohydrolase